MEMLKPGILKEQKKDFKQQLTEIYNICMYLKICTLMFPLKIKGQSQFMISEEAQTLLQVFETLSTVFLYAVILFLHSSNGEPHREKHHLVTFCLSQTFCFKIGITKISFFCFFRGHTLLLSQTPTLKYLFIYNKGISQR